MAFRTTLLVSFLHHLAASAIQVGDDYRRSEPFQWSACGNGFECANISVPLDWNDPNGNETATIAVTRLPAPSKSNR
jgi:hypothetical protein